MPRKLAPLLVSLALGACADTATPPGEPIGTFQFEAALEPLPAPDGDAMGEPCELPESPPSLHFSAVLSYEPTPLPDGSHRVWLQLVGSPGSPREGRLRGTRFSIRAPPDPERVPRSLESCRYDDDGDGFPDRTRCTLGFAEFFEGDLLARVPAGCAEGGRAACCSDEALGACGEACLLADPTQLIEVGGVCGAVIEEVLPEASDDPCLCVGEGGPVPARPCTIVYRLAGVPL